MQAQHLSSSGNKAITATLRPFNPSRRQIATAVVGAALIGYLVHKSQDARGNLKDMANYAQTMGDLSEKDVAIVASLLEKNSNINGSPA